MTGNALRKALICLALLLSACTAHAQAVLTLLDAYMHGGALCFVVRNESASPVALAPGPLLRQGDGFNVPLWWSDAEPSTLPPGKLGLVRLGLRRPEVPGGAHTVEIAGATFAVDLDTPTAAIHLSHLITMPDDLEAALFVRNDTGDTAQVVNVELVGVSATIDTARSQNAILPCDTGVLTLSGCPPVAAEFPTVVALTVEGPGIEPQRVYRHVIPFTAPLFKVRSGDAPGAFTCPTHRHGPWQVAARALLSQSPRPEVHFCRNRAHEGLAALAQIAPRAIVNLQGSNLARGQAGAWAGLREFTAYAVGQATPGVVSALIEPRSNFDGSVAQPAAQPADPLTPRDLQYTVFAALAGGCKGLLFRQDPAASTEYNELASQLAALIEIASPWLDTIAPISLAAHATDPAIQIATLYTGPRAALVIALRDASGDSATPLTITLNRPPWFTPTHRRTLSAPAEPVPLEANSDQITLHFESFRDVAAELLYTDLP